MINDTDDKSKKYDLSVFARNILSDKKDSFIEDFVKLHSSELNDNMEFTLPLTMNANESVMKRLNIMDVNSGRNMLLKNSSCENTALYNLYNQYAPDHSTTYCNAQEIGFLYQNEENAQFYLYKHLKKFDTNRYLMVHFNTELRHAFAVTGSFCCNKFNLKVEPEIINLEEVSTSEKSGLEKYAVKSDYVFMSEEGFQWYEVFDKPGQFVLFLYPGKSVPAISTLEYCEAEKRWRRLVRLKVNKTYYVCVLKHESMFGYHDLSDLEKGIFYKDGKNNFPKMISEAVKYLEKDGSLEAMYHMGNISLYEGNVQNGIACLSYAFECGSRESALELAMYYYENNIEKDKLLEIIQSLASSDYKPGVFFAACAYEIGIAVKKDCDIAFKLFYQIASKGYPPAEFRLDMDSTKKHNKSELLKKYKSTIGKTYMIDYLIGGIYMFGVGVCKNKKRGFKYIQKSADGGYLKAKHEVAYMYLQGICVEQDKSKALQCYREIVEIDFSAAVTVADLLTDETACEPTPDGDAFAFNILEKAVSMGDNRVAVNNLGWMYEYGRGCNLNYTKAMEYYTLAAKKGYALAYVNIGKLYKNGFGVLKNYYKAKEYFEKAQQLGYQSYSLIKDIDNVIKEFEANLLQKPYKGDGKYVFISYPHARKDEVMGITGYLQHYGLNVWYDEGIDIGSEFTEHIAEKILGSSCMFCFICKEYFESKYCKLENKYAFNNDIPRVHIYLEECLEWPKDLEFINAGIQTTSYYTYDDKDEFYEKLFDSSEISELKN